MTLKPGEAAGEAGEGESWVFSQDGWADARPDIIPEKYWDKEHNGVDVRKLAEARASAEKKLSEQGSKIAELEKSQWRAPEQYEVSVSGDRQIPDALKSQDNPLVSRILENAKAANVPQEVLTSVVFDAYVDYLADARDQALAPLAGDVADPEAARKVIADRVGALQGKFDFAIGKLTDDKGKQEVYRQAFQYMASTAPGVELLENALSGKLHKLAGDYASSPGSEAAAGGGESVDDLYAKMNTLKASKTDWYQDRKIMAEIDGIKKQIARLSNGA